MDSLNLLKNSHLSQFEDSEYKYGMINRFLNSNPDFGKCSSTIQTLWDWKEKFTFKLTWPSPNTNLTLNLKNFQGVLSHLPWYYKQHIED